MEKIKKVPSFRDCKKVLSLVERIEKKSLKEYFRKNIWKYERLQISRETCQNFLDIYLEGAKLSKKDFLLSRHILTLL